MRKILVLQLVMAVVAMVELHSANVRYFTRNFTYQEINQVWLWGLFGITAVLWLKERSVLEGLKSEFLRYQTIAMVLAVISRGGQFLTASLAGPPRIEFFCFLLFQTYFNYYLLLIPAHGLRFVLSDSGLGRTMTLSKLSRAVNMERWLSYCFCIGLVMMANLLSFSRLMDDHAVIDCFKLLIALSVVATLSVGFNCKSMSGANTEKNLIHHFKALFRELKFLLLIAFIAFMLLSNLRSVSSEERDILTHLYVYLSLFSLIHVLNELVDRYDFQELSMPCRESAPILLRISVALLALILIGKFFIGIFRLAG